MPEAVIAQKSPYGKELEAGKTYYGAPAAGRPISRSATARTKPSA